MIKISKTQQEFNKLDVSHAHFTRAISHFDKVYYQVLFRNFESRSHFFHEDEEGLVTIEFNS